MNAGAELEMNGAATVAGGTYNIDDDGFLDFDGTLSIGSATFNDVGVAGTADVRIDGITTYTGGTINTTVPVLQQGAATVTGATVINGGLFNLDGTGSTAITLENDLTLNVDAIESGGVNFDGTLTINGVFHRTHGQHGVALGHGRNVSDHDRLHGNTTRPSADRISRCRVRLISTVELDLTLESTSTVVAVSIFKQVRHASI